MVVAPALRSTQGALICPQLNSCIVTDFRLRDSLYHDTAQVPATNFVTVDKFAAPIKIVPRSRQHSIKFVPWPSFAQGLRQGFGPQRASEGEDGKNTCHTLITHRSFSEGGPCTVTLRYAQGFWLKYQDPARCCRRVTQPPHIAVPL